MTGLRIGPRIGLSMAIMALGCSSNTNGAGSASGAELGNDSAATGSMATEAQTEAQTSDDSADGTGNSGPGDSASNEDAATTEDPTAGPASTGGPGETETSDPTDDEPSGGEPPPPTDSYPPCVNDGDCMAPYTVCMPPPQYGTPNFCSFGCRDASVCPQGSSGDAVPVCEDGVGVCVLDCSVGSCPDGMNCYDLFNNGVYLRCLRL